MPPRRPYLASVVSGIGRSCTNAIWTAVAAIPIMLSSGQCSEGSVSFIVSRRHGSFPSVIPRIQPISSQASSPSGTATEYKSFSSAPGITEDLHRPYPPFHLLYQAFQLVGGIEVTPDRFGMLQKRQQGTAFGDPLGHDLGVSRRPFAFEHLQSLVGFLFRVRPPDASDLWPSPPAHPPSPWKGHPSPHVPHRAAR